MSEHEDPSIRILREALGADWEGLNGADQTEISSLDELEDIILSMRSRGLLGVGPVKPEPEDYVGLPLLADDASNEEIGPVYRLAQANKLIRLAKLEKKRRQGRQ